MIAAAKIVTSHYFPRQPVSLIPSRCFAAQGRRCCGVGDVYDKVSSWFLVLNQMGLNGSYHCMICLLFHTEKRTMKLDFILDHLLANLGYIGQ